MPRPSTGPKIFWTGPIFILCKNKNWFTYYDTAKNVVPDQKMISI